MMGASFLNMDVGWRIQPRTPLRERAVREGLLRQTMIVGMHTSTSHPKLPYRGLKCNSVLTRSGIDFPIYA